jgi:hypothetical protein
MFWTPETIVEDRTLIGPLTETSETLGLVRMTQTQLPIAAWARIVIEKVPPETGIVLSAKFPLIVIGVWQEGQSTDSTSEQSCA